MLNRQNKIYHQLSILLRKRFNNLLVVVDSLKTHNSKLNLKIEGNDTQDQEK